MLNPRYLRTPAFENDFVLITSRDCGLDNSTRKKIHNS